MRHYPRLWQAIRTMHQLSIINRAYEQPMNKLPVAIASLWTVLSALEECEACSCIDFDQIVPAKCPLSIA